MQLVSSEIHNLHPKLQSPSNQQTNHNNPISNHPYLNTNTKITHKFRINKPINSIAKPKVQINSSNFEIVSPYQQYQTINIKNIQKQKNRSKRRKRNSHNKTNQLHKTHLYKKYYKKDQSQWKTFQSYAPYVKDYKSFKQIFFKIKTTKGGPQNLEHSLQKYKGFHLQNVEFIMKNIKSDNFKEKMQQFAVRLSYNKSTKFYVCNTKQNYIKKILQKWQWVQNKNRMSDFFHLKWVYTDLNQDYKNIENGQYFNHFQKNQQLTNKNLLKKNLKKYSAESKYKIENIIPKTYDLQSQEQMRQFEIEYENFMVYGILKKLVQDIKKHKYIYYKRIRRNKYILRDAFSSKYLHNIKQSQSVSNQIKQSLLITTALQKQFTYNIQYLFLVCKYLQKLKFKLLDLCPPQQFYFFKFNFKQWNKSKYFLFKYFYQNTAIKPNIQQTPSNFLLSQIIKFQLFFQNFNKKQWNATGQKNLWITKPVGTSKGNGITIHQQKDKIIDSALNNSKLVQKYIQNPLIFNNLNQNFFNERKFDIRQWVLVTNMKNLQIYKFNKFYVRLCSQKYSLDNIANQKQHLTNYSQNKKFFSSKQESVLSYEFFKTLFQKKQFQIINKKINSLIINAIRSSSNNIIHNSSSFQLFGFDILIDANNQTWLLQINLSPACQQRTVWMSEYLEQMSEGLLRIVLPSNYMPFVENYINNWELILHEKYGKKNQIMQQNWRWSNSQIKKIKRIQLYFRGKYLSNHTKT